MKTVAYLRVSTGSQDLATQKLAILDFTQKRRFTVDAFIESRISSRKSPIERRIEEMLGTLQSGDRLLVSELSRLGPQPLSGYWARKSRRPQLPRSWTSPVPPSTTSSRRARSGQADEKARLGQPRPYVVFQHQSGRYPLSTSWTGLSANLNGSRGRHRRLDSKVLAPDFPSARPTYGRALKKL